MNLAEFPLALFGSRANGQQSLVFSDSVFDEGRNAHVDRRLTISPSVELGLPTTADDEVIFGLIQLTNQQGFTSRTVPFSRYQLLKLLGWSDDSACYQRLNDSLFRWLGVTLKYEKAWWSKADQCWVDKGFHLLEDVQLMDRHGARCGTSSFTWNETVFKSFKEGYVRRIDFEFYRNLEGAVAKRMFRFLGKKFYHRDRLEFPLRTFAHDHIGVSRNYHTGGLKRLLQRPIDELTEKGFLKEGKFVSTSRGEWSVVFEQARGEQRVAESEIQESSLVGRLTVFGVSEAAAKELVMSFPEERLLRHLDVAAWLQRQPKRGGVKNLAGFLVKAIQEDYAPPTGFVEKRQRVSKPKPLPPARTVEPPGPLAERQRLDALWNAMTKEEQLLFEQEALFHAERFLRRQYHSSGGGSLFKTVRRRIIDDHLRRTRSWSNNLA